MGTDDYTPEEKAATDALPRTRIPPASLEDRTVLALRERGLLEPRGRTRRAWWMGGAAAAAAILFLVGLASGQQLALKQNERVLSDFYPGQTGRAAALVQQTGTAHALALAALTETVRFAEPEETEQAREVAIAALASAAGEVARLSPNDPIAARILSELERLRNTPATPAEPAQAVRSVVWF